MATIKKKAQQGITLSGPTIYGKKPTEYETKNVVRRKRVPNAGPNPEFEKTANSHEETYTQNIRVPKKKSSNALAIYAKGG